MGRYNSSTLWRLYQIGGPDLAIRYAELSSSRAERKESNEYAKGSDLEIIDLRFFAGGSRKPEPSAREFGSRFPATTTQYVYYQLDLRSPWRYSSLRYTIRTRYYDSADVVLSELTDEFETRPDEPRFSRARGCGKEEPGNWTPGTYRVEIDIDYRHVRTAEFTIFDDAAGRLAEFRRSLFGNLAAKAPWELPAPPLDLPGIAWKGGRGKKR
jgi:hypothetical protein